MDTPVLTDKQRPVYMRTEQIQRERERERERKRERERERKREREKERENQRTPFYQHGLMSSRRRIRCLSV